MSKIIRMQSECPPDAHKVLRDPQNEVQAKLAVRVEDRELERYGAFDLCQTLALMSSEPLICASDKVTEAVAAEAARAEIKPSFLKTKDDKAFAAYPDGAVGSALPFVELSGDKALYKDFLDLLGSPCYIVIDSLSMLIMRSVSTIYPWDKLLASDFVRQYLQAAAMLDTKLEQDFMDVRYGRKDVEELKRTDAALFLRLERKLFLQYPSDD